MIQIADNFQYNGRKPLDARLVYDNITSMKAVLEATIYDGIIAYVKSEKKYYTYDSANTSDPTLGKWRELETGGGSDDALIVASTAPSNPSDGDLILYTGAITGDFTESPALYVYDATNTKWELSTNMVEITAAEVDTLWANN